MFTIGETRPNCDENEPQEDAHGTRQIRQGRLNNETQREQRRKRHQETTKKRQKTTSLRINCPLSPGFASHVFLVLYLKYLFLSGCFISEKFLKGRG